MKKIVFCLMLFHVSVSSVTCLKVGKGVAKAAKVVDDILPDIVTDVVKGANKGIQETWKDSKKAAKNMITDKVIPISQLPLYNFRAENKIYDIFALKKNGPKFPKTSMQFGIGSQRLAEYYGFFDMIDVKHVLCEFFYNSAEIVFYRGTANLSEAILKGVEKLGVLKPEDIIPLYKLGFSKKGQALSTWYYAESYEKFVPLMGDLIGAGNSGKGYSILTKEQVAIKKKYYQLTDIIAFVVWHVFYTYEEEHAPRENLVHQRLKSEQIQGHFMGNSFVMSMLNNTNPLDTGKLKKKIRKFIEEIDRIFTGGTVKPFKDESLVKKIKKAVYWVLQKLGIIVTETDLGIMYKFKLEVLVIMSKILKRADLTLEKAEEIIELSMNHWKIVFYLHVSGTLTSTKPAPDFYNHHETVEEKNSEDTSDSDTLENEKEKESSNIKENGKLTSLEAIETEIENNKTTGVGGIETDSKDDPNSPQNSIARNVNKSMDQSMNDEDYSVFGDKTLEEKDDIAKLMEDKNPFRTLLRKSLLFVDLNMKKIREHLINTFEDICFYLLLNEEECSFIKRSIRNINTYKLKKDGKIASRRYCNEHKEMTEIQGVSMGIVEYLILQSEKKKSLEALTAEQRKELKIYIRYLFKEHYYLRIFVSKEYQKALADYAVGKKDSKVAKLAVVRAQQIKKGIGLMPPKPPPMDPRDFDEVLIPDNS